MSMRIRSWPSAGAVGKRKSGPRARSTNSRPSKQLPAIRLVAGVRPAKDQRRQRTATPILATRPAPAQPDRPRHGRSPRHARGSEPPPVTTVQPRIIFTPHGVPKAPETGGQLLAEHLRHAIRASTLPGDLHAHLAGPVAAQADASQDGQRAINLGQDLSILFIVALLLVVFRSLLAPLLTLAPAVLVTQLAGPVIAQASKAGLQVTGLTQIMLLILTLGAGTDYGLFLVFRVREELRTGRSPHDAVAYALSRGRGVDHLLGGYRHRLAAHPAAGRLRPVLQPRRPAGHRDRAHAAGRPHPDTGPAGHLRPGRVLALEHDPARAAPRLVGTHRRPHRHPPDRNTRPRPGSCSRAR